MSDSVSRRRFLTQTAFAGAGCLLLKNAASLRSYAANEKLDLALIGVGGRGSWFVDSVPKMENLIALCDVNEKRAAESFKKLPQARKFRDFRKMLEEMKEIDGVIIAAPDHIHAPASMFAMRMGKHVFCEKPLTRSIHEARTVREFARTSKIATQMGNQGTSSEAFRRAVEMVQAGVIGEIREVHAWNEGGGAGKGAPPTESQPVPETLDWDLWLGPVRHRPFHPEWLQWHAWREFGTGQLGNWASHSMNLPFKSLKLDSLWSKDAAQGTVKVRAEVEALNRHSFPRWEIIAYEFPARSGMAPVKVTWYNGNKIPRGRKEMEAILGRQMDWGDAGEKKWKDYAGCLLIGEKGVIHSTGHNMSFSLLPEEKFRNFEGPAKTLPRTSSHEEEWFNACRGGPAAMSNFEYAGRLAEFVLLGNVATLYPEQTVEFDPATAKIKNPAEANQHLRQEYREGWKL